MQCCAARNIHIVLKLNRFQIFQIPKCYYATILENYLRANEICKIEMQVTYSCISFSTTIKSSKTSLIDFIKESEIKDKDNHKEYSGIIKDHSGNLDDFVVGLSKSTINRQQRKKSQHERRKLKNLTNFPANLSKGSKENENVFTTKELSESVSQNIYKCELDEKESLKPLISITNEKKMLVDEYKDLNQNNHMSLGKNEDVEKLKKQNNSEYCQNNPKAYRRLQTLNYSPEKKNPRYERNNNKVCMICTSVLQEFLDNNQHEYAFSSLKEYQKQDKIPAFPILVNLASWGGHSGRPDVVKTTEAIARKHFTALYKKNLNFENHLAISHMKAGEVTESFLVLDKFLCTTTHKMYPKISKKKKDTFALIINFLPMKEKSIIDEAELFVNNVVDKTSRVSYALSLWKICFVNKEYYFQQVADRLLERHPSMVLMLGQKVKSIVEKAEEQDDLELLYNLLQLLLHHDLQQHLAMPTSGILKIQCESNDISMAHETLLFAKRLNIRLDPRLAARFYKVLQQYRQRPRIFPRPPPKELPKITAPPTIKYKF